MKKGFLFFLFFCFASLVNAQSFVLNGRIQEYGSKQSVSGALVKHDGKLFLIDQQGRFSIKVQMGDTVSFSSLGYVPFPLVIKSEQSPLIIDLKPSEVRLEDIVVSPSLSQRDLAIRRHDFLKKNFNNGQELLRFVPGLFIGQHAGGGKAEQLFLRGFDIDHGTDVRISVDGIATNMASHAHGQGYADLHYLIPETVADIDFGKGSYELTQGDFATAGHVAFRTIDKLAHHKIKVEAGQFGTIRALALIKLINKEQHHLYAAGEGVFTDGPFQFPQGLKRFNGFIKHNYQNDRNVVSTQFSLFKSSWNASGQIPNRAVDNGLIGFFGAIDPTEGGQTSRYQASTKWNHYTKRGNSFEQQLYVGKYNFELYSNFTFFLHDPVNGDQIRQKENRFFTGYQSQFNQDFKLGNSIVQSMSGFQWRYDNINDIELARTISRSTVKEYLALGDGTQHNLGAFQKFKTDIDGWMVELGLRADYMKFNYNDRSGKLSSGTSSGFVVSPKLKMQKSIGKTSNVYFNIGQGFHSNDMRVSVARTAKETMPTARGYDVGINYKLGRSFLQLGWWVLQSNQEFIYVGDEAIVEPSGRSLRKGIELSIRTEITKKFYTDHHIQYTVARGRDLPKNEAYIPLAPKWLAMGNFQYNGEKLQLQLKYRWMGDRPADELNDVVAKGYFITDLFIERKIRANHQIGLIIENLFNQRWKETQFLTESRLKDEREPVSEIHFTPGSPFFTKIQWTYRW